MPKRLNTQRVETSRVQGEDSYVITSMASLGEAESFMLRRKAKKNGGFEAEKAFLVKHIQEWNWVNDAGEPLPQVKDDPKVMQELTGAELQALVFAVTGVAEDELKN